MGNIKQVSDNTHDQTNSNRYRNDPSCRRLKEIQQIAHTNKLS
jgi:hypothetical protein